MEYVYLGLKILATTIFIIMEKVLMVIVEVYKGLMPANLPPIIQVNIVYCCVYLLLIVVFKKIFMTMQE